MAPMAAMGVAPHPAPALFSGLGAPSLLPQSYSPAQPAYGQPAGGYGQGQGAYGQSQGAYGQPPMQYGRPAAAPSYGAAAAEGGSVFDTRSPSGGAGGQRSGSLSKRPEGGQGTAFDFVKGKDAFNFIAEEVGKSRK